MVEAIPTIATITDAVSHERGPEKSTETDFPFKALPNSYSLPYS